MSSGSARDDQAAHGSYYIYPAPHPSFSNMREVRVKWDGLGVWVEGRGNI